MGKHLITFDWAMKKVLRSKANFGILEGFLSELLKQDIKILNLLDGESNKNHEDDKQNRVDLIAKLQNGEIVLIEVQVNREHDFFTANSCLPPCGLAPPFKICSQQFCHRMLYASSKVLTEHVEKGEEYSQIKKVYSVNILYFDLGHGSDYIYHGTTRFIGLHQQDELSLSDKQKALYAKEKIYQIYPEYYLIKVNQFNDIAKNTLDEWIYFLKHEEIKDNFHAKGLAEAKDKFSELKLSEDERIAFERHIKDERIKMGEFRTALDDAMEKGKQKGRQEGRQEGKIEIAKEMKKSGMSAELIEKMTGVNPNDI